MYYILQYKSSKKLTLYFEKQYNSPMKAKSENMMIRVTSDEKDGFEQAAMLAGISLSSWVRERLRLAAIRELESAGRRVPFIPEISAGGSNGRK